MSYVFLVISFSCSGTAHVKRTLDSNNFKLLGYTLLLNYNENEA